MKTRVIKEICSILALLMCLGLFSFSAFAEEAAEAFPEEEIADTEESIVEEQHPIIIEAFEPAIEDVIEETCELSSETGDVSCGEAAAETGEEENGEDPIEELVEAEPVTVCDEEAGPDNDSLFRGYFESLLMPRPRLRRPVGWDNLTGVDVAVYSLLAERTNTVAAEGGSTVFDIPLSELGTQLSWTKEELGGITIISDGKITQEAKDAVSERLDTGNLRLVLTALQQDYPFGMYWYDKTPGAGTKLGVSYTLSATSSSISIKSGTAAYSFSVAADYGSGYAVDPVQVSRAQTAAENARAIVSTYAECPDLEKLTCYRDEICALTSYNSAAAAGGIPYGDPWQAIYVFDGDPETKVVCEGYSKAFEYLCDMSAFLSPAVSCISVTGFMNGSDHMWNIVTLADGENVLADLTNSDGGSAARNNGLFLVGYCEGNVWEGYVIVHGKTRTLYTYDDRMTALMTENELTLSLRQYTVAFVDGEDRNEVKVFYGEKAEKPDDPIPKVFGVKFVGWREAGGTALFDFSDLITRDTVLEAVWEPLDFDNVFVPTLNLADYTGVRVYIRLPEGEDPADYTAESSYSSYRQESRQIRQVSDLPVGSGKYAGMFLLDAVHAASTEMSDIVTVILKKGSETAATDEFTVRGIADRMIEAGIDADTATLLRALKQYGYYGQLVFGNKTDDLPDITDAPDLTAIPDQYAPSGDPTSFGAYVTKFEGKLDLNSAISMNLYLTPAKGYNRDSFQINVLDKDGRTYRNFSVTEMSGGRIRVRIEGILSPQLAQDFKVVVTLKSNPARTAIWTRSVLSCAYTTEQTNPDANVKCLMQALHQYYRYAALVFPQFA